MISAEVITLLGIVEIWLWYHCGRKYLELRKAKASLTSHSNNSLTKLLWQFSIPIGYVFFAIVLYWLCWVESKPLSMGSWLLIVCWLLMPVGQLFAFMNQIQITNLRNFNFQLESLKEVK